MIDATPQEFPRIDERRFGQAYRYAYTVAVPPDGNPQLAGATRLYKHDLETGAAWRTSSATATCPASSCSSRRRRTRRRTKAGCSAW